MARIEGGCSISIRSLTQFSSEEDLRIFIQGPLSKVIYNDLSILRKAELEGISKDVLSRDGDALLELQERGVEVTCGATVRW